MDVVAMAGILFSVKLICSKFGHDVSICYYRNTGGVPDQFGNPRAMPGYSQQFGFPGFVPISGGFGASSFSKPTSQS